MAVGGVRRRHRPRVTAVIGLSGPRKPVADRPCQNLERCGAAPLMTARRGVREAPGLAETLQNGALRAIATALVSIPRRHGASLTYSRRCEAHDI